MRALPILAVSISLTAGLVWPESNSSARSRIKLNQDAVIFAADLIEHGKFVADSRTQWRRHKPSAEAENDFIRHRGIGEYAKWHLGVDESHREGTKARYKFPFGDFQAVHRCGVLAAKTRARQFNRQQIADAATRLETAIAARSPNQPIPTKTRQ